MLENIEPNRIYTVSEAAKLIPSGRKPGHLHATTLSKAIRQGVRGKGDVRHYLAASMTLGGYVIKGRDLIRFLNDYATAHGGSSFDPSDVSDVSDAVGIETGPAPKPAAGRKGKARAARAVGALTTAASTARVRGARPGR
jgi:hypothetical protein